MAMNRAAPPSSPCFHEQDDGKLENMLTPDPMPANHWLQVLFEEHQMQMTDKKPTEPTRLISPPRLAAAQSSSRVVDQLMAHSFFEAADGLHRHLTFDVFGQLARGCDDDGLLERMKAAISEVVETSMRFIEKDLKTLAGMDGTGREDIGTLGGVIAHAQAPLHYHAPSEDATVIKARKSGRRGKQGQSERTVDAQVDLGFAPLTFEFAPQEQEHGRVDDERTAVEAGGSLFVDDLHSLQSSPLHHSPPWQVDSLAASVEQVESEELDNVFHRTGGEGYLGYEFPIKDCKRKRSPQRSDSVDPTALGSSNGSFFPRDAPLPPETTLSSYKRGFSLEPRRKGGQNVNPASVGTATLDAMINARTVAIKKKRTTTAWTADPLSNTAFSIFGTAGPGRAHDPPPAKPKTKPQERPRARKHAEVILVEDDDDDVEGEENVDGGEDGEGAGLARKNWREYLMGNCFRKSA